MKSLIKFNDKIIVHTPGGDLPGRFKDLTDTPGVACVAIYRDRCPLEFRAAHPSPVPIIFVSLRDVEAQG